MSLEQRLRETLHRRATEYAPSRGAWDAIERRLEGGRRTTKRVLAAIVALLASTGGLIALWSVFGLSGPPRPPGETVRQTSVVSPTLSATISLDAEPSAIAAGPEGVWVVANDPGGACSSRLWHIDPRSNEVGQPLAIDVVDADLALGEGSIWVAGTVCRPDGNVGLLLRLDAVTQGILAEVRISDEAGLGVAVGLGSAWVNVDQGNHGEPGRILRIDATTNRVIATIPLEGIAWDVQIGADAVWTAQAHVKGGGIPTYEVLRIDPGTDQVVARVAVESLGKRVISPHYIWLEVHGYRAWRIDLTTNEFVGEPIPVPAGFEVFAADETGVWFLGEGGRGSPTLSHLNEQTLEVDGSLRLDDTPVQASLDPINGTIWIANYERSLTRVDVLQVSE